MGLVFMIVAGGVLGWLTAFVRRLESARGLQLNIASGILGALAAGLVISPQLGSGDLLAGDYNVDALFISILGAAIALALVNLLRGNALR